MPRVDARVDARDAVGVRKAADREALSGVERHEDASAGVRQGVRGPADLRWDPDRKLNCLGGNGA